MGSGEGEVSIVFDALSRGLVRGFDRSLWVVVKKYSDFGFVSVLVDVAFSFVVEGFVVYLGRCTGGIFILLRRSFF